MKKVVVNENACIGCGACVAIDPEHFDFNDNGLSQAISNENLESSALINAVESCPTNAIALDNVEDCDCKETCNCDDNCHCCDDCTCGEGCDCE